ncbi:MAG: RNA polymerase sigma factor [Steroidobacteraceae bacterium]
MKNDDDGGKDSCVTTLFSAFVECKASLTRYVATFFVIREDIEDAVQETYLNALAAQANTEVQSPRAFLFRVARNIALNRKKRQRKKFEEAVGDVDELIAVDNGPTLFDTLDGQEKLRAFCDALDALPPQCRRVFIMQRMEGLSYQEIAERLGISTRTIEKHIQKALQRCAEHLVSNGFYIKADEFRGHETGNVKSIEQHRKRLNRQARASRQIDVLK